MTAQHQQIEGMLDGVVAHGAGDLLVLDDLQAHPDVAARRRCPPRPFEASCPLAISASLIATAIVCGGTPAHKSRRNHAD